MGEKRKQIMNKTKDTRPAGYWIGWISKVIMAVAMLLYLGLHSYNFFTWTFKDDQWIFAVLGLFTTSIGVLLWLAIYLYVAEDGLEKAVSIIMLFVSLLGEFAAAGFDMFMNISGQFNMASLTATDLRNMSYIVAGLALLNGLALVAGVAGQQILDDLSRIRFPKNAPAPMVVNASETENVRQIQSIKQVSIPEDVYKQLLIDAGVKRGVPANGNGAVDPTKAAHG
jgi:hypothetical protein